MDEAPFDTLLFLESSTLAVLGCVDELHIEEFRGAIRDATLGYRRDLIIDLSDVEFFPSLAIGVLVGAMKQCAAAGARVDMQARRGSIGRRVLEICGFSVADPQVDGATIPRRRATERCHLPSPSDSGDLMA